MSRFRVGDRVQYVVVFGGTPVKHGATGVVIGGLLERGKGHDPTYLIAFDCGTEAPIIPEALRLIEDDDSRSLTTWDTCAWRPKALAQPSDDVAATALPPADAGVGT